MVKVMTITYVEGTAASRAKGTAAARAGKLDLATFDIMGTAVIYQDEFRKFNSADGTWPIVFRSDGRPPSEIFENGFQPRENAVTKYLKDSSPTPPASVALQLGNMDVVKETAVCVSLLPKMTVLFPFDVQENFGEEDVNVYICQVKSWLEVYAIQAALAPRLAYAQEVATTGIDPMDVLGRFAVHRKWRPNGVEFEVTSMDGNPRGCRPVPASVRAFATPGVRTVKAPKLLEEKAYGSATGKEVFGYVKSMVGELRGDDQKNTAQNSTVAMLQATNPLKSTPRRKLST
jgi:hypothetical protein